MTTSKQKDGDRSTEARRWRAVVARDPSADGRFVYSVRTTGVYCRPSCGARRARRENVAFHPSAAAAERAGFRPCKRCRPDGAAPADRRATQIAELCRLIERSEHPPSLEALARRAGLSVFHLHRLFKRITGLTPREYAAAGRAERLRARLRAEPSVTQAIYASGYDSASRVYATSNRRLGMTPGKYRAGGSGLVIRSAVEPCSLGLVLVAATDRGVCAIALGDDADELGRDLARRFPHAELVNGDASFRRLVAEVVRLVENPGIKSRLPLDIRGTVFQERVWRALAAVPAGETTTYTELARAIGAPTAARAVASACAANPLAVAIPCHRVLRADGDVSGYRWGVERKRRLLDRESNR